MTAREQKILTTTFIHFLKKMCVLLAGAELVLRCCWACQGIVMGLLMHSEWLLDGCLMPKEFFI